MKGKSLSMIIPCYNEASRGTGDESLASRLDILLTISIKLEDSCEFIFVDDGSLDRTGDIIKEYIDANNIANWQIIRCMHNDGKGKAILKGIKVANSDYIGFMDADFSVPPFRIEFFMSELNENTCVIASRYLPNSVILNKRPFIRKVVSRFARLFLTSLFSLKVSDTQCGFKIFPAKYLKNELLDRIYPSRWLLDLELLSLMREQGVDIKEIPVIWVNNEQQSTLSVSSDLSKTLDELCLVYLYKRYLDKRCKK